MASRPCRNSARLRQRLSAVYASATRAGSRVFQASSARRALSADVSTVKGGSGGGLMGTFLYTISTNWLDDARRVACHNLPRGSPVGPRSLRLAQSRTLLCNSVEHCSDGNL